MTISHLQMKNENLHVKIGDYANIGKSFKEP